MNVKLYNWLPNQHLQICIGHKMFVSVYNVLLLVTWLNRWKSVTVDVY